MIALPMFRVADLESGPELAPIVRYSVAEPEPEVADSNRSHDALTVAAQAHSAGVVSNTVYVRATEDRFREVTLVV